MAEIAVAKSGARALSDAIVTHGEAWANDPDYIEAAYAAEVGLQCLDEFELEGKDGSDTFAANDYFARRDVYMAKNVIARLGVTDRAVIWAHSDHVMNWLPAGYTANGYSTLGRELKTKLGTDYAAMGVTYSNGEISTIEATTDGRPDSGAPESIVPVPNTGPRDIGRLLANLTGEAAWLDLTDRPHTPALDQWLQSDYNYGWAGWFVRRSEWQNDPQPPADKAMPFDRGFDVMIWFRHITPARRLP